MAKKLMNDCVRCADGCHHCGLRTPYFHYFCDECGAEITSDDEKLYAYGSDDLCTECLLGRFEEVERNA